MIFPSMETGRSSVIELMQEVPASAPGISNTEKDLEEDGPGPENWGTATDQSRQHGSRPELPSLGSPDTLDYNSQQSWLAQLLVKAAGSFSPFVGSNVGNH